MTEMATPSGAVVGAAGMLERSITYLLGNLALVTPPALRLPTPCAGWDLQPCSRTSKTRWRR
jgi:hypothetical protein